VNAHSSQAGLGRFLEIAAASAVKSAACLDLPTEGTANARGDESRTGTAEPDSCHAERILKHGAVAFDKVSDKGEPQASDNVQAPRAGKMPALQLNENSSDLLAAGEERFGCRAGGPA
jgi:hypothetical protein